MNQTPPPDDRTEDDLYHEIMEADWNIGNTEYSTIGVTLTFRKHHTSDVPGMETRRVFGKDRAEAMRRFLAELEADNTD